MLSRRDGLENFGEGRLDSLYLFWVVKKLLTWNRICLADAQGHMGTFWINLDPPIAPYPTLRSIGLPIGTGSSTSSRPCR